jgi:hypothetical protein
MICIFPPPIGQTLVLSPQEADVLDDIIELAEMRLLGCLIHQAVARARSRTGHHSMEKSEQWLC